MKVEDIYTGMTLKAISKSFGAKDFNGFKNLVPSGIGKVLDTHNDDQGRPTVRMRCSTTKAGRAIFYFKAEDLVPLDDNEAWFFKFMEAQNGQEN